MSQENQGNNSTVPTTVLPVKRGRGRPRKYENLPRGEVVSIPSRSDREKRQRRSRIDSTAHADSLFVGQIVSGVLDGVFDAGYLLTVRIGDTDTILRGVVFKPGLSVPIMAENDIAPHVRMFTRSEVPLPAVDSMITRSEVPPPAAERTFTRSEVTPPAADRTFTRSEVTPPAADRTFTRSEGPPSAADRTFARSEVPPQAADRQNQVSVSTVPSGPHIWQPVKLIPEKKASPKGGPALETQVPNLNGPAQKEMFFANDFTSYARGNMH